VNITSWLFWGFVATLVMTTLMDVAQGLGLTRMSIPYMIGTMLTPSRDKAKILGFLIHLINGWLFSLVYVAAFHAWGKATWWLGALIGIGQAGFILTAGMRLMPGIHSRMAREEQGASIVRQLEPPGFLALNYGYQTPVAVLIAHLAFGIILGAFYRFS
jgi:uncharacterized membrane protein YagU involved in acid resistance